MFYNKKGFTLIEILLVIVITVILIGLSIAGFRLFERKTELQNHSQNILTILELARTKTLASENASQYGVYFEQDKYILFKGETYQEEATDNKTYHLPARLEIYNIDLTGGASSTVFQRISGVTEQDGIIGLRIISQPTENKTINIHSSGQIELGTVLSECCVTNRLIDSRHIHLDLIWSIQGANTLTLYFADMPKKTVNIIMADYFNADETEFDWSGKIDVNGESQELRVQTHFLDAIETILCVHRDQDKNNKPVQIFIDGKDIISYTADGEVFVGVYGGTIETQ